MKITLKKNAITLAITLAAASSIFAVVAYNGSQMAQAAQATPANATAKNEDIINWQAMDEKAMQQALSQVGVQLTQAASYQAQIIGYGEAKPRYELAFASEVSGRVEWLSDAFEVGATVKKGELLAKLDTTSYEQAVTQAKSDVASATQALLEEQRQGEQARSEWQRSGLTGAPNSPLVLREPQLASAQAKLANAQQALVKAEEDLANTEIRAPFDSVVVSRDIQPGSYLGTGTNLATLYSIDRFEIEIPLSEQQWANLPQHDDRDQWTATLTNSKGDVEWQASVERSYQYVTQQTRQRSIVLVVDKPFEQEQPLFPGTFVSATIQGDEVDNLWQLPASALSQQGEIWTVDAQGVLAKAPASPVFERQQHIYVEPTQAGDAVQVVLRPLSNFKVGMKVSPTLIQESNEAQAAQYAADKAAASLTTVTSVTESGEG
ncbi:efflux RND transporter periplasmic adaptor subunit [Photobacterium rosenbergii]|uniref:efflux RND transporter periplasmic adaptor subunit n=1 Tax=Photobacterium rosenbergii TaxID=294936 RepID=UPI001C99E3CC|nr:efflux RND transporter periplasmic adaptor subunit [Photobacterium rosenbergii]MBY5948353.1 efflux RND transporter periplasmic adaptor subunit [Photobacterium rosenbergii]